MVGFIEALGQAAKNSLCSVDIYPLFRRLKRTDIGWDEWLEYSQQPWLSYCNGDPSDLPDYSVNQPPFTGGQCSGISYTVRVFIDYDDGNPNFLAYNGILTGKITSVEVLNAPNPQTGTGFGVLIIVKYADGASTDQSWFRPVTGTLNRVEIARLDGQPDTCGDPPSSVDPVSNIEDDIDVTYDDPQGNPINLPNLPITFFEPCINLDGVRIPFEVQTPLGKICGKIGVAPSLNDIVEPQIDIDLCPSQKTDLNVAEKIENFFDLDPVVGSVTSTEFQGALTPEDTVPSKPIAGVIVKSSKKYNRFDQSVIQSPDLDDPAILVPSLGIVVFEALIQTSEDQSTSAWMQDIPIKLVSQFVPCPHPDGAVNVKVIWRDDWTGSYQVARKKSCCEACKEVKPQDILDNLDRCRLD